MDFQAVMFQLNGIFARLRERLANSNESTPIKLYDDSGHEYSIIGIYTEDEPVICIDIKREPV